MNTRIADDRPGPPPALPYGRQWVDEEDVAAVVEALRSDWLTTGPRVTAFERAVADFVGAREGVAVSSGTAALHAAVSALGVGPGDEVLVPALTFAASANCAIYCGASPVFVDVQPDTLLIDPESVARRLSPRTRAVVAVDYAGQPCDYGALRQVIHGHDVRILADACHALGAADRDRCVGTLGDLNTFSFHPVKPLTTAEGGLITTDDAEAARRMRRFRNHGITTDHFQREKLRSWRYEVLDLGFNYRISDLQCALGLSQLGKLPGWVERRQAIARQYDDAFASVPGVTPLTIRPGVSCAYHLYVIRLAPWLDRSRVFNALRAEGIGVNVHYIPVHLHPFYARRFGTGPGLCPVAEEAYEHILSLPIFPRMSDGDVDRVIETVRRVTAFPARQGDGRKRA